MALGFSKYVVENLRFEDFQRHMDHNCNTHPASTARGYFT